MGLSISRVAVTTCLVASGVCCVGMMALEHRAKGFAAVSAEPDTDAEEVAAVIEWAKGGAGRWTAVEPAGAGRAVMGSGARITAPPIREGLAALDSDVIRVPASAQAGGGKVSAIKSGSLRGGGGVGARRLTNVFSRALSRSMAPPSSRTSRIRSSR